MSQTTLMAAAAYSFAAATIYFLVGYMFLQRRVSREAGLAQIAFGVWWIALALTSFVGGFGTVLAAFDVVDLFFYITTTYLNIWFICLALAGLLYYLVYVYTGMRGVFWPIAAAYVAFYLWLVFIINASGPSGVLVEDWSVTLEYERELDASFGLLFVVLLIGPQLLAAVAYFTLVFRLQHREQRFRVAVVSTGIILWFGTALAASFAGFGEQAWWQVVSRVIGLSAAVAILIAYHPPGALRRWLHEQQDPVPVLPTPVTRKGK